MSGKCNETAECTDQSDENYCEYMNLDNDLYRGKYPPSLDRTDLTKVLIHMRISTIMAIEEIEMQYKAKIAITMKWFDKRITFHDLRESQLNIISGLNLDLVWEPTSVFNNSVDNIQVVIDKKSVLSVIRKGNKTLNDLSEINEGFDYRGAENPFELLNEYSLTLSCGFKLKNYPFDKQICSIEVRVFGI